MYVGSHNISPLFMQRQYFSFQPCPTVDNVTFSMIQLIIFGLDVPGSFYLYLDGIKTLVERGRFCHMPTAVFGSTESGERQKGFIVILFCISSEITTHFP